MVLRQLRNFASGGASYNNWDLYIDDVLFIPGDIVYYGWQEHGGTGDEEVLRFVHNFPDGCVVVNEGETLKIVNGQHGMNLYATIIGHFE